ncbi:MAG: NAD-dependent epimerase/dehydratase family protein [Anaerolineales bacterium]|jgi:UDP-glucose 4-epimerase|nr:NAD-dependent epimerase/dehydratase family protein [Anaerolineales bacterium]
MRVLITGGAGFIGSHVADQLLARGDIVLVIDNYATGRRDNLSAQPNLAIIEGTIADTDLVNRIFDDFQPEVVVHAAASYKDPNNWEEDARTNAEGTTIIVKTSERVKVRRFIYFQTALCYGLHPIEQPITLEHPLMPGDSSYAISKTAGEYYTRLSSLDYLSFRLANAYGPRNLSGPPPTFYNRLTTKKPVFVMDTRRDFIYINDLVEVVMKAIDGCGIKGIYHISSGKDYAIKELFDATIKALGIEFKEEVEVRPRTLDDVYTILLDPTKTHQDFNWQVTTSLETGIQAAIDYYRKYGVTETYTHLKPLEAGKSKG